MLKLWKNMQKKLILINKLINMMKNFNQLLNEVYNSFLNENSKGFSLASLISNDKNETFKENPVEILINWLNDCKKTYNVGETLGNLYVVYKMAIRYGASLEKKAAIRKRALNGILDVSTEEQLYESAIKQRYVGELKFPLKYITQFVQRTAPGEIYKIVKSIKSGDSLYSWCGTEADAKWQKTKLRRYYKINENSPSVKIMIPSTKAVIYVIKGEGNYVFAVNKGEFETEASNCKYNANEFARSLIQFNALSGFADNTAI